MEADKIDLEIAKWYLSNISSRSTNCGTDHSKATLEMLDDLQEALRGAKKALSAYSNSQELDTDIIGIFFYLDQRVHEIKKIIKEN